MADCCGSLACFRGLVGGRRQQRPQPAAPEPPKALDDAADGGAATLPALSASAQQVAADARPQARQAEAPEDREEPPTERGVQRSSLGGAVVSCPWHDGLAYFLTSDDLARSSCTCLALQAETTVVGPETGGRRRLLLAPVVELRTDNVQEEMRRVSLPHVHVLRVWDRLSFNTVAEAVVKNKTQGLRSLDKFVCKGCRMCPDDIGMFLAPTVATTGGLKLLNLEKNMLTDDVVVKLASSRVMAQIETLNLRFNLVGDKGATAIANSGAHLLKWVNLKMNRVTDTGAMALASKLSSSQSMTLLNLRRQHPGLTDRTAIAFAEALRSNDSLQQLRLRRNRISDKGAAALAEAVAERTKMQCARAVVHETVQFELDLEDNRVNVAGALALLSCLAAAPPRARLELLLCGNPASRATLAAAVGREGAGASDLDPQDARLKFHTKPEGAL